MCAMPDTKGRNTTLRDMMEVMMPITIPVQARKEANIVMDIPLTYLFILLKLSRLWLRELRYGIFVALLISSMFSYSQC